MIAKVILVAGFCAFAGVAAASSLYKDTPSEVVIHATNVSAVPSVHYIVDAVECLKEAYSIYPDDKSRAELYAELFQEKHPETQWNVVVGYSVFKIRSEWYVETSIGGGGDKNKDAKKDKDKDKKEVHYLIFSQQ